MGMKYRVYRLTLNVSILPKWIYIFNTILVKALIKTEQNFLFCFWWNFKRI